VSRPLQATPRRFRLRTSSSAMLCGSNDPFHGYRRCLGNIWFWSGSGLHLGLLLARFHFFQKMGCSVDCSSPRAPDFLSSLVCRVVCDMPHVGCDTWRVGCDTWRVGFAHTAPLGQKGPATFSVAKSAQISPCFDSFKTIHRSLSETTRRVLDLTRGVLGATSRVSVATCGMSI